MPKTLTAVYVVKADPNIIYCSNCHMLLGEIIEIDNVPLFKVGSLVLNALHGTCECGREFHFATNDAMLAALLRKCLGNG